MAGTGCYKHSDLQMRKDMMKANRTVPMVHVLHENEEEPFI